MILPLVHFIRLPPNTIRRKRVMFSLVLFLAINSQRFPKVEKEVTQIPFLSQCFFIGVPALQEANFLFMVFLKPQN